MNDLQTIEQNAYARLLKELKADFEITSWDDFARRFLLGDGKSPNTTRAYLQGCKQFYDYTAKVAGAPLHPWAAATPEWIESFYDSLDGRDLNTKALRIKGLRFMYRKMKERYPTAFTDPFEIMTESLQAKLNRSTKDEAERDALTEKEYQALLAMLANDTTLKGYQNYALIRFGVMSGMRADELVSLRWECIAKGEEGYKATFTGKGSKVRTIQIEAGAYNAAVKAYQERWHRQPILTDYVFHALPTGGSAKGITKACVHRRIKTLIQAAKELGLVRANLNVSTHTLRHTCATLLLAEGVDIYSVSKHLGHSNISTTSRYLHNQADKTDAFKKISGEAA